MHDPGRLQLGARSRAFSCPRDRRQDGVHVVCSVQGGDAPYRMCQISPQSRLRFGPGRWHALLSPAFSCARVHKGIPEHGCGVGARRCFSLLEALASFSRRVLSLTSWRVRCVGDVGAAISGGGCIVRVPSAGYMLNSPCIRRADFAGSGKGKWGTTWTLASMLRSSSTTSRLGSTLGFDDGPGPEQVRHSVSSLHRDELTRTHRAFGTVR